MIRCIRIWTAEDGNSSFEEGQIDLSGGARGDVLSEVAPSSSISFRETKAGGAFEWHDAPESLLDEIAKDRGLEVMMLGDNLEGEARALGAAHARQALDLAKRAAKPPIKPIVILSGGETTVTLRGKGRGGRNVEYLLAEAIAAGGTPGIWGLAADTDGVDGAVDIAGAIFTPDTLARARANGRDPQAMLDDNDGHSFFEMLGDSLVTGPTRTNVNDFRATLIAP